MNCRPVSVIAKFGIDEWITQPVAFQECDSLFLHYEILDKTSRFSVLISVASFCLVDASCTLQSQKPSERNNVSGAYELLAQHSIRRETPDRLILSLVCVITVTISLMTLRTPFDHLPLLSMYS